MFSASCYFNKWFCISLHLMGPELSCYALSCSQRIKIVPRFCHKIATNSQQTCTSPTTRKSLRDNILQFFGKNCASEYITEFYVLAHNYWNTKRSVCSLKIVKCTKLAGLPRNYGKKHQFSDCRNWRSTFPSLAPICTLSHALVWKVQIWGMEW